jgi:DUF1365 family protein
MRYEFYLKPPADSLFLRIGERGSNGVVMVATFAARRRPLSTLKLLACCAAVPTLGVKIIGAIHLEALRLWLKGLRPLTRPPPPPVASVDVEGVYSDARTAGR